MVFYPSCFRADRVREKRIELGYSVEYVASVLGLGVSLYCCLESGTREPYLSALVRMCDLFGCTADWLCGRVDSPVGSCSCRYAFT